MREMSLALAIVLAAVAPLSPAGQTAATTGKLTIESLIDIKHPTPPAWSPDSTEAVFVWECAGVGNVWRIGGVERFFDNCLNHGETTRRMGP